MIYLSARAADHRGGALNAIAVAASFAAAVEPLSVLDPGFVLSFGATFAIVIAASRIAPPPRRVRGDVPRGRLRAGWRSTRHGRAAARRRHALRRDRAGARRRAHLRADQLCWSPSQLHRDSADVDHPDCGSRCGRVLAGVERPCGPGRMDRARLHRAAAPVRRARRRRALARSRPAAAGHLGGRRLVPGLGRDAGLAAPRPARRFRGRDPVECDCCRRVARRRARGRGPSCSCRLDPIRLPRCRPGRRHARAAGDRSSISGRCRRRPRLALRSGAQGHRAGCLGVRCPHARRAGADPRRSGPYRRSRGGLARPGAAGDLGRHPCAAPRADAAPARRSRGVPAFRGSCVRRERRSASAARSSRC